MQLQRERFAALLIIAVGFGLLYPLQRNIDVFRNTFRVIFYADAQDRYISEAEAALELVGLAPERSRIVNSKGQETTMLSAVVPQQEWGKNLLKYAAAVNQKQRIDAVLPSLNDQGIPLDQLHELNLQDVGIAVIAALLGGFRKSAANVLWLQSDANWYEGRHYRTVPLGRLVTTLDPQFVEAWTVTCWHLAYNMSVEAKSGDEAAELIRDGIEFAETGLPWNTTRYELYQEIGWTYYDKLQNYARAAEYFKKAIDHPHPTFLERAIAHAYERIPDIDKALFWYDISLKKYGEDPVATGAIITIKERYLDAWNAFKEGRLEEARQLLNKNWQKDDPYDTIGMHFKARIYEQEATIAAQQGDYERQTERYQRAFETWLAAAQNNASDRLARRRVLTLADQFWDKWGWEPDYMTNGKHFEVGFNDVGLPASKIQEQLKPEHGEGRGKQAGDTKAGESTDAAQPKGEAMQTY